MLLGLSDTEDLRKVFHQTDICRIMIRQLEADNINKELILQIMINISSDEYFQHILIDFNVIYRICNLLFEKLDKVGSQNGLEFIQQEKKLDVKYSKLYFYTVAEQYVIEPSQMKDTLIPYYFMLLTNLTIPEQGQTKFLNLENEKIKGITLMKVLDKFFENIYSQNFNFCSNLLANVTSHKEGRLLILEHSIFKIFLVHFDKLNNFKITNILRVFRNCCFEFETYKAELLVYDAKMFNLIIKVLLLTNVNQKIDLLAIGLTYIDEIYLPNFNPDEAEKEVINDVIIDILLVLTNLEEAVTWMKEKDLKKVFNLIKEKLHEHKSLRDRLFVITNYIE
jgi:hypothetical protein